MTSSPLREAETETICFVTGKLAETSLRKIVAELASQKKFMYVVEVLPITVAALMSTSWIAKNLHVPTGITRLILPGYCSGDISILQTLWPDIKIEVGPRDLRRLPEFFGNKRQREASYGKYSIEIIAEINHAPRLTREQILHQAQSYAQSGADIIDLGCIPGELWHNVGDAVKLLRDKNLRVSIDSLQSYEIALAVKAGAELVLSVNAENREAAIDWGCEVVVIPEHPQNWKSLEETIDYLAHRNVPLRIDPILEPIGCGFAASLGRYIETRRHFPDAEIMMGIGNITELTDADSAGLNMLLLGFCEELGIRSVLTTEVINWARNSVQECQLARQAVHYAVEQKIPPKHVERQLVTLRDAKLISYGEAFFNQLAGELKDKNYRLFAEDQQIHVVSKELHLSHVDGFQLFANLMQHRPENMTAEHAFYLGYEMAKASIANTLSKEYKQDEALNWGYLTREEERHRLKLAGSKSPGVEHE
jgi:dihydropteroate synthase